MRFTASVLAGLTALAAAHPTTVKKAEKFGCGTLPTDKFRDIAVQMRQKELNATLSDDVVSIQATLQVNTYFHVLATSTSVSGGYLSDATLAAQLAQMNSDFSPYGITFVLAGTDKTVNAAWARDGSELTMKKALRKGGYGDLNLYFLASMDYLGYCYLPDDVTTGSNDFYYDGCSILSSTVPGGSSTNYNEGKTVTHEVGHWFGLLHTFEGYSCTGAGDEIDDTPAQLSDSSGCPIGRDSCPNQAGVDPIHNFMDYTYDSCYEEFTPDQVTRMYNMYDTYRA